MPDSLSVAAPVVKAFDEDGDELTLLEPVMIQVAADGVPDVAQLAYRPGDHAGGEVRVENLFEDYQVGMRIYVCLVNDPLDHGADLVLFEGTLTNQVISLSPDDESATLLALGLKWSADGEKVYGQYVDPAVHVSTVLAGLPAVFNDRKNPIKGHNHTAVGAIDYFGPQATDDGAHAPWSMLAAVAYLDAHYHPTFLDPIGWLGHDADPIVTDTTLLENLSIQGLGYAEALTRLLTRAPFHWYVDYQRIWSTGTLAIPKVFRMPDASASEAVITLPVAHTDLAVVGGELNANLEHSTLNFDAAGVVNTYTGLGAYKRFEAEFELRADWDPALNVYPTPEQKVLRRPENPNWPTYKNYLRRFILNEDGRQGGTPFDFDWLFGEGAYLKGKVRKFLPCFPVGGRRQDFIVRVNFHDGKGWINCDPTWAPQLLEDSCGVYFAGMYPPHPAGINWPTEWTVRVTAVVESDERVWEQWPDGASLASEMATWKLKTVRETVIDRPNVWHSWYRYGDGEVWGGDPPYAMGAPSQVIGLVEGSETAAGGIVRDDSASLLALLVAKQEATADLALSTSVRIPWLDFTTFGIGQVVQEIAGRGIDLSTNADPLEPHYPTIVGLRWHIHEQSTEIILDDWRESEPELAAAAGPGSAGATDLERRIEGLEDEIREAGDRRSAQMASGADEIHMISGVTIANESTKSWPGRVFVWHPEGFAP